MTKTEPMQLIIVSGLSGSGKSIALETLEDSGFYCIDNLPIGLFEPFVREAMQNGDPASGKVAISIDARSRTESLEAFPETLRLAGEMGIQYQILFLRAADETLIKRFSETRRKHPLTDPSRSLTEAIAREQQLLVPIASRADLLIDTTHTNIHQLRELIRRRIGTQRRHRMSIYCLSFGFKHGIPHDADFTFDVRCLPNPHWEPALRHQNGCDPAVSDYLERIPEVQEYLDDLTHFLLGWIPRFARDDRNYLTLAIGCTGGQHRSVFLAEALAKRLESADYDLLVRHRDLH